MGNTISNYFNMSYNRHENSAVESYERKPKWKYFGAVMLAPFVPITRIALKPYGPKIQFRGTMGVIGLIFAHGMYSISSSYDEALHD